MGTHDLDSTAIDCALDAAVFSVACRAAVQPTNVARLEIVGVIRAIASLPDISMEDILTSAYIGTMALDELMM